ncbi:MAG TPA: phosphotransferase, partial [Planctomycetota bacterium]|nr:phosphotransferase [Planctomycetota bacterium]
LLVDAPWADAHPGPTGSVPLAREVLVREFVDGEALHRATSLASNFFERLEELVDRMHAEGVCHNDLHKEQNILVDPRGFPCLIDFQLASVHSGPSRAFRVRVHEDRRHVQKHRRRYLRDGRGPVGSAPPAARLPRKPLSWVWRRTGKPIYHWFTRSVLGRWDGEERRPSTGPWPRWTGPLPPW